MPRLEPMGVEAVIKGLPKYLTGMKRMGDSTQRTSGIIGKIGGIAKGAIGGLLKLGVVAGGAAVAGIAAIGAISIKTAISVESAFAGVAKTTDGLVDEFGQMTDAGKEVFQSFRNLAKEVPITVEELLAIGELAGQLGVPKQALVEFTETVAALGVTTNLTQEAAATALAQIANIFQVSADDMALNTAKVGSALVDLGNNFATTEADILTFAQRIAGAGNIAGLTQADILGIGAAFSSVGIEAESGGTAVQKVLLAMVEAVTTGSKELDVFGKTVGLTAQEFAQAFEEDAAGAFKQFVFALGEAGDDAIGVLGELGLQDQRLVRAFLSLSNAGELLGETLEISNIAFEENSALTEEAEKRYQTTESQLKIFKNTLRDIAITIGGPLLGFLNKMLSFAKPLIENFGKRLPKFLDKFTDTIEKIENVIKGVVFGEAKLEDILPPWVLKIWEDFIGVIDKFRKWWERNGPSIRESAGRIFGTIKDTIETLAQTIIPWLVEQFGKISAWFDEHEDDITGAIKTIADFFEFTLGPAITNLWTKVLGPFLGDFIDGILEVAGVLADVFGGGREEFFDVGLGVVSLGPRQKADFTTSLEEIEEVIKDFLFTKFPEHFRNFRDFVLGFFGLPNWEEVAESWRGIWDMIGIIFQQAIDEWKIIIEGSRQLLMDFMGDISMLAAALRGDPIALAKLLSGEFGPGQFVPRPGMPATQAHNVPSSAPRGFTETSNFNLTVNTSAPTEPIIADFRMLTALGGRP